MHLFYDCLIVKRLRKSILSNNVIFLISTPQSAIFGFWDLDMNEHLILNHSLLIFKMYIYNAKTIGYLNISHLLIFIKGIKDTEKKLCDNDVKRRKQFNKKWKNVLISSLELTNFQLIFSYIRIKWIQDPCSLQGGGLCDSN